MKFVVISDTHCRHKQLRLPAGDVLIHAGDITARGRKEEVKNFLDWFSVQPFGTRIFIPGNHDFYFEHEDQETIEAMLPPGVIYLNDSGTTVGHLRVWGSPVTPRFFDWAFNKQRGAEIRKHWEKIPPGTDLLITHGPPYGFLDMTGTEQHVGCQDLLRRVLTIQPRVHVFGHIHESYGMLTRSGIRFFNACMVNEQYVLTNRPLVFEL